MKPRQRQRLEKVKNKLAEQDKHEDRVPDDPITFCREWLRDKPNILYNYCIVNNVVKKILLLMNPDEHINIHIDRSLSRTNREDFNLYVRDKVSWVWEIELEKQPPLKPNQIQVAHENSHSDPCIQLVDYIAGATFQKYERNRPKYYALIESRVESSHTSGENAACPTRSHPKSMDITASDRSYARIKTDSMYIIIVNRVA